MAIRGAGSFCAKSIEAAPIASTAPTFTSNERVFIRRPPQALRLRPTCPTRTGSGVRPRT